jgi:hypothetical protein
MSDTDRAGEAGPLSNLPPATCYRTHTQPDEDRGVFGAVWLADVRRALPSAPDHRLREALEHRPVLSAVTGSADVQLECACGWLWDDGDTDLPEGESFMRHAFLSEATPATTEPKETP